MRKLEEQPKNPNTQIYKFQWRKQNIDKEEVIKKAIHQIQNSNSIKDMEKINRKMTGLEKIFSKPQINSPFQFNLHKELLSTNKKQRQETQRKIDTCQK